MRPFPKVDTIGYPNMVYFPMQESKTVPGSVVKLALGIAGTTTTTTTGEPGAKWVCQDRSGNIEWCKGIRVKASTTGGNLQIHIAENPVDEYDTYDIPAGNSTIIYKEGLIFDEVIAAATTIDLDDVTFLL